MNDSPIAVTSPADILAYVPHTLGFAPRESFVLMTMHGKRLGVTLRVDAHQEGNPEVFAASVIGYLANDQDADGSLFILYTTHPTIDGVKPFTAHAEALDTALHAAGMGIRDSWLVTDEHWMTYFCDDVDCCTAHPLAEIADSALNARLIFDGSNAQRDSVADPVFTGEDAETILNRIAETVTGWAEIDPTDWTTPVMTENRALWKDTTGTTPTEETAVQLVAALHTPSVRDRIMADTINPSNDTHEMTLTLIGRFVGRPDWSRVDAVQQLATDLLPFIPNEARAPLFTLLGWINWYKGKGSIAHLYLTKALEADPESRLAALLLKFTGTGVITECTKSAKTAYQR